MADDTLGHNPLGDSLDSIWKIPKKQTGIQRALSITSPLAPPPEPEPITGSESWVPLDDSDFALEAQQLNKLEGAEILAGVESEHLDADNDEGSKIEETIQVVGFKLSEELFGIDIMNVQEIIRSRDLTRVPKTASFISGVVNLRGKVVPVVDLNDRFGLEQSFITDSERIIIANTGVGIVGFKVDEVTEVFHIPVKLIDQPPSSSIIDTEYITGVGRLDEQLIVMVNLDQLVLSSDMAVNS